ncbi:hypothetical protein GHT06_018865 [Daphnia sinensis]|uniref:Fatty acyl-CoA reductase n=1 Tax=Daphnia sinensis TaxID=1820382 RepID=A0AAD5PQN7_9CRUS|nr:hypothetical protein GHT06_018865 [Daphnia sinensis]
MEEFGIQEFYSGRSVFITGATGFMGKVLVEKLLRSCPGIVHLYLLIRPTPDKNVLVRLQELISCKVFEWLKQNQPDALDKLIPVNGDVSLPDLGLSLSDMQELSDNVSVVFHSAARVKFDDNLRNAIDSNVKGPQRVANFCRQLKKLKAFVHVSTTYNNLDKKEIVEEVYPASLDPQKLVDLVDSMDDQLLASITKPLIGNCPNVYAYTKALGEQLLLNLTRCDEGTLPLVIVRPSTVTGALKEPLAGWIDSFNGPSGLVAGVGRGLIYTIKCDEKLVADLVPVDFAINLMIAAAWNIGTNDNSVQLLIWLSQSHQMGGIQTLVHAGPKQISFNEIMRYPSIELRTNWLVYQIEVAFYHRLPAILMDVFTRLCGRKPFLTRLYNRTHRMMSCLEFYCLHEWNFVSRNPVQLMAKMTSKDRDTFNFDVNKINWETYLESYVYGIRTYLFMDDSSTLPAARKALRR